jgi:hypothetical protein
MPSPHARTPGSPMGLGMVERANTLVVQARLPGVGHTLLGSPWWPCAPPSVMSAGTKPGAMANPICSPRVRSGTHTTRSHAFGRSHRPWPGSPFDSGPPLHPLLFPPVHACLLPLRLCVRERRARLPLIPGHERWLRVLKSPHKRDGHPCSGGSPTFGGKWVKNSCTIPT